MNKKTIQLTTEQAQELYKQNPDFRSTILSEFSDKELGIEKKLKSWGELLDIEGFFVRQDSIIINEPAHAPHPTHRNIFATEKQAKSALAMAQLSQLMKDLGDECNVDWTNGAQNKFVIELYDSYLHTCVKNYTYSFLAFKTVDIRNRFMEKHEQLIKEYFML